MRREAIFRDDLCTAVKAAWGKEAYVQKNFDPAQKGQPDCEFVILGKQCYVELKAVDVLPTRGMAFDWGREPTAIQLDTILRVERAGGNGRVALLVWPVRRVFVRSAGWIFGVRGGLMPRAGTQGAWTVLSLSAQVGFDWDGPRTSAAILSSILVEGCL